MYNPVGTVPSASHDGHIGFYLVQNLMSFFFTRKNFIIDGRLKVEIATIDV
ncbi:hypothetical protein FC67_GL001889 [Companilactobacillus alimentarius DSM 20249]|nr:hypothetical protein FC67_GL001889 [Companilactobacillus alimentarius DSM 20249]